VRTRLVLLGGQTVALGLMIAFLVVPVSALFLDEYGAVALPYVYLGVAAAGVAVSSAMSRAQRRYSLARLAAGVIAAYLLAVAAGWVVLMASDGFWVTFPLLVLFPLSIPIGFVVVGSQAGRLLDVRQMKAHFPRVVAGFSVGFALGGVAAAGLVRPLGGARHLLGLDLLAAAALLALVVATARAFPAELAAPPAPAAPREATDRRRSQAWRAVLHNRMVALILGYQVLSAAVTQLLDYMVWERAAARYSDASAIAQFQGVFGAVINVTSLALGLGVAGWLLTRYGIGFGLAANPVGVLVLLATTTVVGYAVGPAALGFFLLVCSQSVTDIALTDGTTRTSINATYQALPSEERLRAQTLIEGAGVPLALGLVGLLLIAHQLLGVGVRTVGTVTLGLTVLWLVWAVLGFREYGVNLRAVIARRAWDPVALRIDDATSRAAVEQLLRSPELYDVQAALDARADNGDDITGDLLALMADDDPARRTLGVQSAVASEHLEVPAVGARIRDLLDDPDAEVALHAAAACVGLSDPVRDLGRAAWSEAVSSEDEGTRRAALVAASDLPQAVFVPQLLALVSTDLPPVEVLDALAAHADHLAGHVEGLLGDSSVPVVVRARLIHFLGRSGTDEARDLLVAHLDDGDPAIVEAAAECLVAGGHREQPERLDLPRRLAALADRTRRCLEVRTLLIDRPDQRPLRDALGDEVVAASLRAQVLLGLVHGARPVGAAVAGLASPDEHLRNAALEVLEVSVARSSYRTVLALVDPTLDDAERLGMLDAGGAEPSRSLPAWLRDLVADPEDSWRAPWLRACAVHALPGAVPDEAVELARPLLDHPDVDVAETARWVSRVSSATDDGALDVLPS
jgi:hypothetical protein